MDAQAFADNVEDVIIIRDESIALQYTSLFEELFSSYTWYPVIDHEISSRDLAKLQSQQSRSMRRERSRLSNPALLLARDWNRRLSNNQHPDIRAFQTSPRMITAYFSPSQSFISQVIHDIHQATHSLSLATYVASHPAMLDALITRCHTLENHLLFDEMSVVGQDPATWLDSFRKKGITPYICWQSGPLGQLPPKRPEEGDLSMHLKSLVIDDIITWAGSANFSNQANSRSDENTLRIHCPHISAFYKERHQQLINTKICLPQK